MSIFDRILGRNEAIEFSYDLDLIRETSHKAYIKKWALDTCINHIARTISQTKFEIIDGDNKDTSSTTHYKLNVRPNTDESAATFWQKVIRKLIYDNEVLIVVTDTKDLIIADDFVREEYALYDDIFDHIVVGEFEFERSFRMSEVIYLEYNNEPITNMLYGLFSDYGDVFGRLIRSNLMNNQIRATLEMDANTVINQQTQENIQNFINKAYDAFSTNDVAIVPVQKGYNYTEHTNDNTSSKSQIEEMAKVPNQLLSYVARNLGIPLGLINGDTADIEAMTDNYMKFCIKPIIEKITDELNAKLFSERGYKEGKRIKAISIDQKGPLEVSEAIDKLIASGSFNRDEIRVLTGFEPIGSEEMQKFIITKNYQTVDEASTSDEGGDINGE
ncbi:phage portal protein [Staphylococcus capitis]|uniref:Phage portal protein n=1 Tax=Staphylococcus capitis TaxID=29388 RepID=A0A848F1Q8_STACP|nr:phage portal protein [Staphylococcus capitis]MBF2244387.1 phage portal protein [Staphylococcus capitis]MBF2248653.1 phage portal protein [Staphylococcus capitis]MBF2250750.1 phage portal protein [Staphylococcus capitis]MBF2255507.1 phage portal protein [Staphylococcus capitis]